ncbi:MAG TPA: hypothetical protein VEL07_11900 [Planctomycetota bacterium]|nr:hypothetical protein [Planctomycetota bacterium]
MQNLAQEPTNTICPVCGQKVDPQVAVVIAPHQDEAGDAILRIGTCCDECRCTVSQNPDWYFPAAIENTVVVGG